MSKKRVVVTGLGTVNPLGNSVADSWAAAKAGENGVGTITLFDASKIRSQIAGEVKDLELSNILDVKEERRLCRFEKFALYASDEAMRMAGLTNTNDFADQAGVLIGTGIGGIVEIEQTCILSLEKGPGRISPFFIPMAISNMASGLVSIKYGTKGYNACVVSACSTGAHAIGDAARLIRNGEAKLMIAGGTEASICTLGVGGFAAMHALSTRNDDPATASRPFDMDRNGFIMGEGCGILVLEEEEFARARGANIICELAGYGYSSDAHHISSPTIEGPMSAMKKAMADAKLNLEQIDYINAHGTSTSIGDANEISAIKHTFGQEAQKLNISSTKSMTGHLLGGAGGVESIFSIMALRDSFIPPTINVFNQDPTCDLNVTANVGVEKKIENAMSNSFGFGGTNATLIFKGYK